MKTDKHAFQHLFRRLTSTQCLSLTLVYLVFSSYSAMGADWLHLDPNPAVQPPKWDWQLIGPIKINPDTSIKVYDIDMFDNDRAMISKLHSLNKKVICYIDVGSWENWRDDKTAFPASILGAQYSGYPDERWLDIRDVNPSKSRTKNAAGVPALARILRARFNRAQAKGCDAIEPDNMAGYQEPTGFPLTYADQIYFNLWLADEAHVRGMKVGLKNDNDQAKEPAFLNNFDFVVSEECFQYNTCSAFSGFLNRNKPVYAAEYAILPSTFCPKAKTMRISAIKKRYSLNATRAGCSGYY